MKDVIKILGNYVVRLGGGCDWLRIVSTGRPRLMCKRPADHTLNNFSEDRIRMYCLTFDDDVSTVNVTWLQRKTVDRGCVASLYCVR